MKKNIITYLLLLALSPCVISCNEKDDNEESVEDEVVYVSAANTAVSAFSLRSDTICENLDKVFFTIDLIGKQIFNADSLPVGTDVSRLRVDITYPTTASDVVIRVTDGIRQNGVEINYKDKSYDSIDFTGKVLLKIVAQNEKDSTLYNLKVNVHKMKPDSLYWDRMAVTTLPSQETPIAQKTIEFKGVVYNLIHTATGYDIYTIDNPGTGIWQNKSVNFGFVPEINSFIATSETFFILSAEGKLYSSSDSYTWSPVTDTNVVYSALYGGYTDKVLAVSKVTEREYHCHIYTPGQGDKDLGYVPSNMPVSGFSSLITYDSNMALAPQAIMVGGADAVGVYTNSCWGFDGEQWARISVTELPGVYGAMIFPYKTFKVASDWSVTEYNILMMMGGKDENDLPNNRVLYSYDNGVYWVEGSSLLQLPSYFPLTIGAQAIVADIEYTRAGGSQQMWQQMPSVELPVWCYPIDLNNLSTRSDYSVTWNCPYIYVFGGTDMQGHLNNTIWRGVLNRLSFKPLI